MWRRPLLRAMKGTRVTPFRTFSTTRVVLASPVSSSSSIASKGEPVSYFDYLDRAWNSKWFGTVEADAVNITEQHSWFIDTFLSCQSALGVEAGVLLLLFGGLTRLFTLLFSFYGERASARMLLALPKLQKPQDAFNRVYYNDEASSLDVQVAASLLKNERRKVFKEYETSNMQCLASFAGAPFLMYGVYNVSAMCADPLLNIGTSSFLWCPALGFTDPTFILPTTFCVLTLMNFELSLNKEVRKGWMMNVVWAARLGCVCFIPVVANLRTGVCLYFIGMNIVGLLQPLLLRVESFRKALGFPPLPSTTTKKEGVELSDPLQTTVSVQFPYLSHLLRPQAEENEDLFKRATTPTKTRLQKPDLSYDRRFTMGKNPLMQEAPIRKAAAKTAKTAPSSTKGLSFASGWKAPTNSYSEDDFIPEYKEGENPTKKKE